MDCDGLVPGFQETNSREELNLHGIDRAKARAVTGVAFSLSADRYKTGSATLTGRLPRGFTKRIVTRLWRMSREERTFSRNPQIS